MKRKICAVTGSRAEYGILKPLFRAIETSDDFSLEIVVTGAHLSQAHGGTVAALETDGFRASARVEILGDDDSRLGTAKTLGRAVAGIAEAFAKLSPDLVLLLGDRYETFAAAQAALMLGLPVAHVAGGDTSEGAFDEAMRHSVTKMAHLHFTTHEEAAARVRQLGEDPRTVFNTGSPALDALNATRLLSKAETEAKLGFKLLRHNLLVTFHPATLEATSAETQFKELLAALDALGPDFGIVFTQANADPEGRALTKLAEAFAASHPNARVYASLGQPLYWSVMSHVDAVVGNSSSGLYEAPSFGKPTVDVGDRQRGRLAASSVTRVPVERNAVRQAVLAAVSGGARKAVNPYGDGRSAPRILAALRAFPDFKALLKKSFHTAGAPAVPRRAFLIAEAGVNHNGSLETAKKLVDAAKDAGADAVKFQTFAADRLVTRSAEKARYQKDGSAESQWEMLKKLELDAAAHRALFAYCGEKGIEFMSTPFDLESVDLLVSLGLKRLKAPSGELTNAPLLFRMAKTGLPLIVSTGMATVEEIEEALDVIAWGYLGRASLLTRAEIRGTALTAEGRAALEGRVTLLHCTTAYPALHSDINLLAMETLERRFGFPAGLSDHSLGIAVPVAAAARGAAAIEKHFTLDKRMPGPDHKASLDPQELKFMVKSVREAEASLGTGRKEPAPCEAENRPVARKSLVAASRVKKGEKFTEKNLAVKRPGTGISPMEYGDWLGREAARDYEPDEVLEP